MYSKLYPILFISICITYFSDAAEVIWAVNCGGDLHVDKYGIKYLKDMQQEGEASDYGKHMIIRRVNDDDQILYQTERYHTETFGYNIPIRKDGSYVLVLKFSEVWFSEANRKVFDVSFNDIHTVISGLDIFSKVGRGVAHDEMVPFLVEDGEVHIGDDNSAIALNSGNILNVQFVKKSLDNPKINAMYVLRGKIEDVPQLPPLVIENNKDDEEEEEDDEEVVGRDRVQDQEQTDEDGFSQHHHHHQQQHQQSSSGSKRRPRRTESSHRQASADPYSDDLGSIFTTAGLMVPIAVAAIAVVPLLFCLCRL